MCEKNLEKQLNRIEAYLKAMYDLQVLAFENSLALSNLYGCSVPNDDGELGLVYHTLLNTVRANSDDWKIQPSPEEEKDG